MYLAEQVRIQIDPGTEQVKKFLLTNRYLSSGDINRFKNRIDPDTDHIFCRPQKVSQRISILPPPLQNPLPVCVPGLRDRIRCGSHDCPMRRNKADSDDQTGC